MEKMDEWSEKQQHYKTLQIFWQKYSNINKYSFEFYYIIGYASAFSACLYKEKHDKMA